ncbi:MAG TPA: sigma-70 family RNA polymerase sigma factor [Kofleriaceae bacterium]|nr:sigma-70 family RNA polymerase sigma factor [Kofleriaceae bacterium]
MIAPRPTRKQRAARLAAKAKDHPAPANTNAAQPNGANEEDVELDPSVFASEPSESDDAPAANVRPKKDNGTYLSMYFRDMATLDVLRPEEEFTAAKEIEALEMLLWETALNFTPALEYVLDVVDAELPGVSEVRTLRKLGLELAGAKKASPSQLGRFTKAMKKAARELRERDADKLFQDAVVAAVDRLVRNTPVRGVAPDRRISRARGFADWARRVAGADRAVADARNDFVKANLRLVVSIARRFNHGRMALADLIQEGNLGLMKAVERYDYRRGFRFSTYASWWIRHAISRALADKGREIRLPVHMIDAQHRLAKARRELTSKLGRTPTTAELAEATQMPEDKVEKMRSWVLDQSISIDRPVGDEDGRNLSEILEDPDREEVSPTDDLAFEAMTAEIRELLGELRPIEADILRRRFGLDDDHELTLKEIGEKYNLSRERIRQLQEQALSKMRRALQRKDML